MFREWQFCHDVGVGQSDDESAPTVYHPGKLSERSVELGDEVDGVDGDGAVNAPSGKGNCVMDPECNDSRPVAMSRR